MAAANKNTEIERRFFVKELVPALMAASVSNDIVQGYFDHKAVDISIEPKQEAGNPTTHVLRIEQRDWLPFDIDVPNYDVEALLALDIKACTVRVRITVSCDDRDNSSRHSCITIKSKRVGISCQEFEYDITNYEAEYFLGSCETQIVGKRRSLIVPDAGKPKIVFELDQFSGENFGLVLVELELGSEDQEFEKPSWLGDEIPEALNKKLSNYALSIRPINAWDEQEILELHTLGGLDARRGFIVDKMLEYAIRQAEREGNSE